jgi:hypothetical protein
LPSYPNDPNPLELPPLPPLPPPPLLEVEKPSCLSWLDAHAVTAGTANAEAMIQLRMDFIRSPNPMHPVARRAGPLPVDFTAPASVARLRPW